MPPAPVEIVYFADLVCPFCYVAAMPLGRLQAEGLARISFRPFELHPDTPAEGIPLASFPKAKIDAVFREVQWTANEVGLTVSRPTRLSRSRLALEGVEMAREALGEKGALDFAGRCYQAYFAKDEDLGQEDVLRGIALALGISTEWREKWLLGRRFGAAVEAAKKAAEDQLVSGVPAMVVGGHPVAGYQPYARLRKLVESAQGRR